MTTNTNIQAVIFDLDDTLYPEIQYVRSGYQAIAQRLAGSRFTAKTLFDYMWTVFQNGQRQRVFNETLAFIGEADEPQIIAELVSQYRCHRPAIEMDVEMLRFLERTSRRYKTGLITDGYLPAQRLKVEALNIAPCFNHIIFTEELGRKYWKPAGKAFELMADNLGCPPAACVYIADNPVKDFLAPNMAGWKTIQYLHPQALHAHLDPPENGSPQIVCHSLAEVDARVNSRG